ncbi:unnamed protein product [Heterobilharzia americana]|nr:unnamed protein product [Heterobilharzia americana]
MISIRTNCKHLYRFISWISYSFLCSNIEGNKYKSISDTETEQISHPNQNVKKEMIDKTENLSIGKNLPSFTNSISSTSSKQISSRINCYSSLNLGFHLPNKSYENQPIIRSFNSQYISSDKIIEHDLTNEYSRWDFKNGVCSDVEDLLNQHERRLISLSGEDGGKKAYELTKFNSASDTEELLSNEYRIPTSLKCMNYAYNGSDPIHPSSYNWLRKVNNETVGDGLHNRYFVPPRLNKLDCNINQPDRPFYTPGISSSLLTRAKRKQIEGRSSSIVNDDAEKIYGIVPLSPSYLYHQFIPSTGMIMKGLSGSSNRNNQDSESTLPGTISAPPGTPIKLPYAPPASLIGTTSGFSCPNSSSQIINDGVNGSKLSLTSNGSCVSTVEEKQAEEIQKLKRQLEQAEKKVSELTTQLTTNVS